MVKESDIMEIVTTVVNEVKKQNESVTHLDSKTLVLKTNPIIAFRGAIDTLEAEIICVQHKANQMGHSLLVRHLEEVRNFIHHLIYCEISGEKAVINKLCDLTDEEIHEHSHHPGKYYGIRHFVPSIEDGEIAAMINKLRVCTRETEIIGCKAFEKGNNNSRCDIIHVLNRLSSLFHVVMARCKSGYYHGEVVEIEASGRHIHLSVEDKEKIFGKNYQLTKVRDLSQPGQYVCKERLTVEGPKGALKNVVILGPERKETQVEISMTDARALGINPVIRQSGSIKDTPGAKLIFNDHVLEITQGVIVAGRHVHVHTDDARRLSIKDGDFVSVKTQGERSLTFHHVLARVSDQFSTYMHIDYDEANACGLNSNKMGIIIKEQ